MTKKADKVSVKNRNTRLTAELLETAEQMHDSGLLTDMAHDKIILRHADPTATRRHLSPPGRGRPA